MLLGKGDTPVILDVRGRGGKEAVLIERLSGAVEAPEIFRGCDSSFP